LKQVFFRRGEVLVEDVPPPAVDAGCVLVRTAHSCVSPGTEGAGVRASAKPLWRKAIEDPSKLRRVLDVLSQRGPQEALRTVQEKLDAMLPTGYSASGTVIAVGEGITDIAVGDRVACAGSQCAFHAEVLRVPRNLCVPVPTGLALDVASTVTLGAIALQGLRRAQPTLGETFAVIGLGLLGQITVQLLKANGCRVVALDIDAGRMRLASDAGVDECIAADHPDALESIGRLTGGHGVDGAIVTAAGSSSGILSQAFRMCRRKGRVVLVGDVGLDIDRADIYEKELDFLVSTSYGPGRYDRRYEEEGLDYPIGYVRWTENRNMAEYLALLAAGTVRVEALIAARHAIQDAPAAYAALSRDGERPLAVLLDYDVARKAEATIAVPGVRAVVSGKLRLALVGAGTFARAAHLPALRTLADRYAIRAVMSRTGHQAKSLAVQAGAEYATSDFDAVLSDSEVDAVLIATRHHLHAKLALRALQAGKHVLVEKPLALLPDELASIEAFYAAGGERPVLLTGFNRRFSQHARAVRALLQGAAPAMLDYRMNAGFLPGDHWVFGEEGGGRNLGEACHIYDLFTFLTDAKVRDVQAASAMPRGGFYRADDNFTALIRFEDGSVASLVYTAMGDKDGPKERLDAYFAGKHARLEDYRRVECSGSPSALTETREPDKGLKDELQAFHGAATGQAPWPIPLWQQVQATRIAFSVQERMAGAGS
jgi:predicted dehydrogenase/threonine dehydrogenase-like Zn-dependent dehydrogenase